MAIRPARTGGVPPPMGGASDVDRPRPGANQTGAGSPTTQQEAGAVEVSSMTDSQAGWPEWGPQIGWLDLSDERRELIKGLYRLAGWVADHPEVPLPKVAATVWPGRGSPDTSWETVCARVDAVAVALGVEAVVRPGRGVLRGRGAVRAGGGQLYRDHHAVASGARRAELVPRQRAGRRARADVGGWCAMTRAMDAAWRVHDLAADALVRVDAKAGFAATVETAATAAVLTLAAAGATSSLAAMVPLLAGGALLAVGVVLAVLVVLPVLRSARLPEGASRNFLYFGAIAAMEPTGLTDVLVK